MPHWIGPILNLLSLVIFVLAILEWRRARHVRAWARFAFDNYCHLISQLDQDKAAKLWESLRSGETPPPWPPSVPDANSDQPTSDA